MNKFYPVYCCILDGNEKEYLEECIKTGWIGSNGPFIKRLEQDFSKYCNQEYGSCVANGSGALDVAFRALKDEYKWNDYDEVIIPDFNIISAAQSCIYNKLKPVFVDAENETWNIDVNKIEDVITKKTKAIVIVHIYGLPSNVEPILNIAEKYNLKVIEDAAQAHGQEYNHKKCGSFSDISTFSFFSNKHVACGEGGIILTSNENLYKKAGYYKNLCFSENRFVHDSIGWNYRMSNLQAAVACAQLEKIDKTVSIKKHIGSVYQEFLKDIPAKLPAPKTSYAQNHYWVFGIVLNKDVKLSAKDVMLKLKEQGIETRPFFYPMHNQPVFKKLGILDTINRPISEKLYQKGFYIPSGLNLSDEDLAYISEKIKLILK